MTVIVACSWGGKTAIAADSMSSNYETKFRAAESKLERYAWGVAGFSGSWRMTPVVHEALRSVKRLKTRKDSWALVAAIEEALTDAGWKRESADALPENNDLYCVLASPTGIWSLWPDLSIQRHRDVATTGCGYKAALAAAILGKRLGLDPVEAAKEAARVTCDVDPHVGRPVRVIEVAPDPPPRPPRSSVLRHRRPREASAVASPQRCWGAPWRLPTGWGG